MIVDVTLQVEIDDSGFKKGSNHEKFCEELAKLEVELALKDSKLLKNGLTCKARKEVEKTFEGAKFIKDIILHRIVADDYLQREYYFIEITLNEFPNLDITSYETVMKYDKKTGILAGYIGGAYFANISFETYKEFENEFNELMHKTIKEKKKQWKVIL